MQRPVCTTTPWIMTSHSASEAAFKSRVEGSRPAWGSFLGATAMLNRKQSHECAEMKCKREIKGLNFVLLSCQSLFCARVAAHADHYCIEIVEM